MSNETQGYPDLELCEVMVGQVFLGWVECRNEDTGKTVRQWVLLKANRHLWPLAFEAAESDRLTQVDVDRVKAWKHNNVPVDACAPHNERGEMCETLKAICCGVSEDTVETFRVCDVTEHQCG